MVSSSRYYPLDVCCFGHKLVGCRWRIADKAAEDLTIHASRNNHEFFIIGGLMVGPSPQPQNIFDRAGYAFVGCSSRSHSASTRAPNERSFGPLPTVLIYEGPLQLGDAGVSRRKRSLVVVERVPRGFLQ